MTPAVAAFATTVLIFHLVLPSSTFQAYSHIVPKGTMLKLVLKTNLSTRTNKVGDPFVAELAEPVRINDAAVLSTGTQVSGSIARLEGVRRMGGLTGKASVVLRFEQIRSVLHHLSIEATLLSVHELADESKQPTGIKEETAAEANGHPKDIPRKGAVGVTAGIASDALFGNVSRRLLLGSVGGAVAILAMKGNEVTLAEGTGLLVRLDRDLELR